MTVAHIAALHRFAAVAGWPSPSSSRHSLGHFRSLSSISRSSVSTPPPSEPQPSHPPSASPSPSLGPDAPPPDAPLPSSAHLAAAAAARHRRQLSSLSQIDGDGDCDLSTLPDPRNRVASPVDGADAARTTQTADGGNHAPPSLDDEVATLSTKLIHAINHQTSLDDTLASTRVELARARDRIRDLERQVADQRAMLAGDVWVRRRNVEHEKAQLLARLADEKKARQEADQQRRKMELELESLTTALFEEANKMVISAKEDARREHDALQRRNDQLRAQLADTEGLLRSQQEQLAELKHVLEQMTLEQQQLLRDDATTVTTTTTTAATATTVPSSPRDGRCSPRDDDVFLDPAASSTPQPDRQQQQQQRHHQRSASSGSALQQQQPPPPPSPSCPTSLTHLIQPVLRTDLAAFLDFRDLLRTSKRNSAHRVSGGSYSGLAALGIGLGSSQMHAPAPAAATGAPSSSSSSSTSGPSPTAPSSSAPQTPNTPASAASASSPQPPAPPPAAAVAAPPAHLPPLKDTKFYKRVLAEDVEPTLRLDMAPGVSWMARRAVLAAVAEGTLVVEPVPTHTFLASLTKPQLQPCALCGESRPDEAHLRHHRFRTSEDGAAAQRCYPLCGYCVARVRATCDFLGFLRIVRDGLWRADDEDAERAAWEESVRLREHMFWSRIGGGVVPVQHQPPPPQLHHQQPQSGHGGERSPGRVATPPVVEKKRVVDESVSSPPPPPPQAEDPDRTSQDSKLEFHDAASSVAEVPSGAEASP